MRGHLFTLTVLAADIMRITIIYGNCNATMVAGSLMISLAGSRLWMKSVVIMRQVFDLQRVSSKLTDIVEIPILYSEILLQHKQLHLHSGVIYYFICKHCDLAAQY